MNLIWHDLSGNPTINQWDSGAYSTSLPLRLTLLKKVLLSAGWTVIASGDGTNKVVGSDNSGSFTVNGAWIILQDPGGGRCFGFQRGTSGDVYVTIKYVATGGIDTSTGSGTAMCSALTPNEDKVLFTNHYVDYPSGVVHAVADADAPYGFYLVMTKMGQPAISQEHGFGIIFDPVTNAHSSETDAAVIYVQFQNLNGQFREQLVAGNVSAMGCAWAWMWKGTANEYWGGVCLIEFIADFNGNFDEQAGLMFPRGLRADIHRGYETALMPAMWGRIYGPKGVSTMCDYGYPYAQFGQTLRVTTARDRMTWGPLVLKWVGEKVAI